MFRTNWYGEVISLDSELNFKLSNPNGGRKGKSIVLIRMKLTCNIHTVIKIIGRIVFSIPSNCVSELLSSDVRLKFT